MEQKDVGRGKIRSLRGPGMSDTAIRKLSNSNDVSSSSHHNNGIFKLKACLDAQNLYQLHLF